MDPNCLSFRPQVEVLESKDAPSTLHVNPPEGPAATVTATIAEAGCVNGITANANAASSGVVHCVR